MGDQIQEGRLGAFQLQQPLPFVLGVGDVAGHLGVTGHVARAVAEGGDDHARVEA